MNKLRLKTALGLAAGMFVLLLSGCGDDEPKTSAQKVPQENAVTVTLDAERQDIYDTNCKVCHGMAGTGAPVSGQTEDWQGRVAVGMDTIVDRVMDGYQAMPPMGGCFDCTEEDFRELTRFMTNGIAK